MMDLVTIEEAKLFVRVDANHEDALFATLIGAASAAVIDVADGWTPVAGEPVPDRIKLAVLTHVATAYERGSVDLPAEAARLLHPLRRLEI